MNAHHTELLIQLSRRQLWSVMSLVLLLGLGGIAMIGFPGSELALAARKFWMFYPLVIAIQLATLRSSAKRAGIDLSAAQMRKVLDDDLRRDSLRRSYRNAFMAMLVLQPLLAWALTANTVSNPVPLMGIASAVAGVVVALASLLCYDR